jgi:hypothetical protein
MRLKSDIERMEVPNDLSMRSKKGIYEAHAEVTETKRSIFSIKPWKFGSLVGAAVLVFSILLFSNSGFADAVKGFFSDITKWNGAVIGTEYNNATNEINVAVGEKEIQSDKISFPLVITLNEPDKGPYSILEAFSIGEFEVLKNGEPVNKKQLVFEAGAKSEYDFEIQDEEKLLAQENHEFKTNLAITDSSTNDYTLVIKSFFIQSKGDAPLEVKGQWEVNLK